MAAAAPISRMGTEEQKQVFREALKGTDEHGHVKVAAMALSEPSTGSDISGLSTSARAGRKTHFASNGSKQWIYEQQERSNT